MVDWGVLFTTDSGAPFVTPQSIPLSLLSKQSTSINAGEGDITSVSQSIQPGRPVIPFVYTTIKCILSYSVSRNICTVSASRPSGNGVIEVYFFTIFPQPIPDWGIAVWDSDGVCVLTNETKVLTDIEIVGVNGSDSNSGFNINTLKRGKFGVIPSMCGLVTGVIQSGGTRPFSSQYFFSSVYDGVNTRVSVALTNGNPPPGTVNVTYHNMKNRAYTLNLSNYD